MSQITKEITDYIIKEYQNGKTCRKIGESLKLTHATVSKILKRNNIIPTLYNKLKIKQEFHDKIINYYENDRLNTYQIAKKYNVSKTAIINLLKQKGVEIRPKNIRMRKIFFNENYFNNINTPEKAYWLGFLYADGYNDGKYSVVLHLQEQDKYILEKFKKCLDYKGKLHKHKRDNSWSLSLNSVNLSKRLSNIGCFNKKSLTLKFPEEKIVSKELMSHFIRGYFDGDGCVTIFNKKQSTVSFVGSFDFIDELQRYLIVVLNKGGYKRIKNKIKELSYSGTRQSKIILDWLYNNSTIHLKRKYNKYLEIVKIQEALNG